MTDKYIDDYSELWDPSRCFTAEMGDYISGSNGELLSTEGLGPCVGIALFDNQNRKGYLVHTLGPSINCVYEFLSFVDSESSTERDFTAWVAGGQDWRGTESIRADVLEMLNRFGIEDRKLAVEWSQNNDDIISMQLDTEKGTCVIETTNEFDYDIETYLDYEE